MKNKSYILEIAIFTVKSEFINQMPVIREGMRKALKVFNGLQSLQTFSPINGNRIFADIAQWDCLESAQIAAKAFEAGDERFLPYIQVIEKVDFMGHFISGVAQSSQDSREAT